MRISAVHQDGLPAKPARSANPARSATLATLATLALLALFLSAPAAYAQSESIVLETFEYPPIYQNSTKPGLACELVIAAFQASETAVQLSFVPVKRMISDVASGTVIAGIGGQILFEEPGIQNRVRYSAEVMYVVQTFMYDSRHFPGGLAYRSLEELAQYRIGVLNGSGIMRFLENSDRISLIPNSIHEGSAKQLYHDRIDLWAIVDLTGAMYMKQLYPLEQRFYRFTKPYNLGDVSVVFSAAADPEGLWQRRFEEGLAHIKQNGTYLHIMADYYGGMEHVPPEALVNDIRVGQNQSGNAADIH